MKIAIVGSGALGSYYGAKLCRAGHETHFLVRSDLAVVRRDGVRILSAGGDFSVRPAIAGDPGEIGQADLVVVALKTTANAALPALIPPLLGAGTAVLTLQNGLGNEEALAAVVRSGRIFGGLCFVCLNREAPGVIRHIAHGRIVLGAFQRPADAETRAIARIFEESGVPCSVTDDLARVHWEKLVWNIPFNGLGVASVAGWGPWADPPSPWAILREPVLTTDRLLSDARWAGLVRELMLEVIAVARTLGHAIPYSAADEQIQRTRDMGAYRASTVVDFELGRPLELDAMFLQPLRHAVAQGVPAPRLRILCEVLERLSRESSSG
ncbi:MAG: 2-dehydropantoate 2-reductase [Verrucomicrobiae bacterium]|nr:2-dehydropantoate 2-reductase [Verrucomicrobiae bacterium]